MVSRLRALWRRLPIPYAVRARVSPWYGIVLHRLTRNRRSETISPHRILRGPVIVSGFLSDVTGIGRAGRMTVSKLREWGVPLLTHDIRLDPGADALRGKVGDGGVWICHCNAPQVLEMLASGADRVWADRYRIGYWAYELESLPRDWLPVIPYFHEIWTPSQFVADAVRRSNYANGTDVRVVPHPLPELEGVARDRALVGFEDRFVFLGMFDARSSYARKNPMGTLRAFQTAFAPDHPGVALVIKVVASEFEPAALNELKQLASGWPNIRLMTEHLTDRQAMSLIASADCLVSLHRSEGFGLTIAEAMALGTPVIATDWSGNVDFSRGAVVDVPYELVPAQDPSGRYAEKGARWAEPSIDAAAEAMRRMMSDTSYRTALVERAREQVTRRLEIDYPSAPYERFIAPRGAGKMRIFAASLATETNTFSPVPTDMASFRNTFYAGPGEHPETPTLCSSPVVVLRQRGRAEGFTVIEGTSTWAEPGGLIRKDVFETLRDEILAQLREALPVDGVVLGLHGAMVADGYDDPEGDFLARVREIVGPDVIVAAELDPHSHLTPKRVAAANILASFLEFPHTDFYERGEHVVDLALRAARGEIRPVISSFDCQMIGVYPTSQEPMRSFVDRMMALEGHDDILSVSFIHGFMAADVPEMGSRMLVVTDGAPAKGAALAERLGREIQAMRGKTAMPMASIEETLAKVRAAGPGDKPFVVADVWDNPGGGVAGDNTVALRAIIEGGFDRVGVATIWDPQAAAFCLAAGEGAVMDLRFGGKAGNTSGQPIDARIEVLRTTEAGWQSFGKSQVPLGVAAVVRIVGTEIDVILNTNRTQTFEPDVFTNMGVDFAAKDVLLIKSTNHFFAGFNPIAREVLYARVPGPYPDDPRVTNYRKLTRPVWPRDDVFAEA